MQFNIQLEDRGKDRYGRTLGLIRANGYDMNWQMIKDGYAWDYDRYSCGRSYQNAEKAAREAGRGLWAESNPMPPWEYRRQ
jgi:endonuclease YncB( thermonuclease family)